MGTTPFSPITRLQSRVRTEANRPSRLGRACPLYKCNRQYIVDYAHLWDYTRDLYQPPGVADTVKLDKIKAGYYGMITRGGIIPKGPSLDFDAPHQRRAMA